VTGPTFCTTASERVYITEGPPVLGPARERKFRVLKVPPF
jgi:hypothetical protein